MFLKNWARLYSRQTEAELLLESELVRLPIRYRAQHPMFSLHRIVDFALLDLRTIIEVDGASHLAPKQRYKDLTSTLALQKLGWKVVRVTNSEVLTSPARALEQALAFKGLQSPEEVEEELRLLLSEHPGLAVGSSRRHARVPIPSLKKVRTPKAPGVSKS